MFTPLAAIVVAISATASQAEVQIAQTYLYHGEEFHGTSGTWWGLYAEEAAFVLREVAVTVAAAKDDMFDGDEEKTGKQVSTGDDPEHRPLILVRGVSGWTAGPVTAHLPQARFIYPGEMQGLQDSETYHVLLGTGMGESGDYGPMINDYELRLVRDPYNGDKSVSQTLCRAEVLDQEGRPGVVWSGDLDRDGKPDLLMNLSDHYNVSHLALYLSSAAEEGELVGKVAELVTTGC